MQNFLYRLKSRLRAFMYGRYGQDDFSKFLLVLALLFMILSIFLRGFSTLALAVLIYTTFRMYSRNIPSRQRELYAYKRIVGKIKGFFTLRFNMIKELKTFRYFRCPQCKAWLRVPKGKGKIELTCRRCANKFIKKS